VERGEKRERALTDSGGAIDRVSVVLVDYEGNRHSIQGRAGQTLREACEMNGVGFVKDDSRGGGGQVDNYHTDFYTESLFGEGALSP
jgi:hypothetical protein